MCTEQEQIFPNLNQLGVFVIYCRWSRVLCSEFLFQLHCHLVWSISIGTETLLRDMHMNLYMVSTCISNLDPHKANGFGGIPSFVLKKCAPELSHNLSKFCYKCFSTSWFRKKKIWLQVLQVYRRRIKGY